MDATLLNNLTESSGKERYDLWSVFIEGPFVTIIWGTILFIILLSIIAYKIKKEDPMNPKGATYIMTMAFFESFEETMDSITGKKLRKAYPYLFTLFWYILLMSLMSILGYQAGPSTPLFTFALGSIMLVGIIVVGIGTKGLFHWGKEQQPSEIMGNFSKLLSISIRLFGATFAGFIMGEIIYIIFDSMGLIMADGSATDAARAAGNGWVTYWPIIGAMFDWIFTLADVFGAAIQAFVFTFLTTIYWTLNYGVSWDKKERDEFYKIEKAKKAELKALRKKQKLEGKNKLESSKATEVKEVVATKED